MNTIPSISSTCDVPYTVVREKKYDKADRSPNVTILLVNRGGKFHKEELLADLSKYKFAEIIYIEGPDISYEIDPLLKKFPRVKFVLLKGNISTGEKINLGISESGAVFTFVLWSNMKLAQSSLTKDVMEEMEKKSRLCIVPLIANSKHEPVPTIQVPGYMKGNVKVMPWHGIKDSCKSLFPFDYCGIYHKKRFINLRGFDPVITNPYWQKIDFGFRAFLWGEEIQLSKNVHIHYIGDVHSEDVTPDEHYKRFYLKNIYVKFKNGLGYIPYYKFLHYLFHSGTGLFTSWKEFNQVKQWVQAHSGSFKNNAQNLIAQWEAPEE